MITEYLVMTAILTYYINISDCHNHEKLLYIKMTVYNIQTLLYPAMATKPGAVL